MGDIPDVAQFGPMSSPYGLSLSLDAARTVAAAAAAEARAHGWTMAIAVTDPAGTLVYFERIDDTQAGSADIAIEKARSAARFKRPTKAFQDTLATGGIGLRVLAINGAVALEGGLPIVVGGRIVGAIGVSGSTAENDGICAQAGVNALG